MLNLLVKAAVRLVVLTLCALPLPGLAPMVAAAGEFPAVRISGAINPVVADFIADQLA